MADPNEYATPEQISDLSRRLKESNEDRKRDALRRKAQRAHEWRVQVWAQSELRIREASASLEVLGSEPLDLFKPEFDNDDMLHHYASMPLSK